MVGLLEYAITVIVTPDGWGFRKSVSEAANGGLPGTRTDREAGNLNGSWGARQP
ncbi:MAG: hypothetical protein JRH19_20635 [Deltaproteobacteria bacterium]|nr:hypothetical protein [Deltaproteobacteria bacterium]